jgi:hypothetical protein
MSQKNRALTPEEVTALGEEYRLFLTKCETQAAEQRVFLQREIRQDPRLNDARKNSLCQAAELFQLRACRVDDQNVLQMSMVQVVYNVEDDLYAYLRQSPELLPERLRGFLDGGIELQSKATAVDTMPQTGKTRRGRRL